MMQKYLNSPTKESEISASPVNITPYKYNGGQLYNSPKIGAKTLNPTQKQRKTLLSIDKFEVTTTGAWLNIDSYGVPDTVMSFGDGTIHVIRDDSRWNGTKHYQYGYKVELNGEPFGTILTAPRSTILDASLSQIKIDNHILYERGWVARAEYIMDAMELKVNNFTGIDIAADGSGFLPDYKRLISGEYKKKGRATYRSEHKANGDIEGFYIGRRDAERFIRGYHKGDRVQVEHKDYILDFWRSNGLNASGVERLELSLRSKAIKRLKDFDWKRLEDQNYLAGILRAEFKNYYEFVDQAEYQSTGNISRCKTIHAIDWSQFEVEELEKESKVNKPSVVWAAKQYIRFKMMEYYCKVDRASDLFGQTLHECYQAAKDYGIKDWFMLKVPKWESDHSFHAMLKAERLKAKKRVYYLDPTAQKVSGGNTGVYC